LRFSGCVSHKELWYEVVSVHATEDSFPFSVDLFVLLHQLVYKAM
jgi:hypothetical protein